MALKLITPPEVEPISLQESKEHLRVIGTDDDNLIASLITAAREYCENFQNRAYIQQTWNLVLDAWPENQLTIPRPPLQLVEHIEYKDSDGLVVIWNQSNYIVDTDSEPGRILPLISWPSTELYPVGAIRVKFIAGYPLGGVGPPELTTNVPARVKQAILLLVAHWYENREGVLVGSISKEMEFTVSALLWQDRVMPV